MTRRELFRSALICAASNAVQGSQVSRPLQNFPGTKFHAYSRCLPAYLSSLARDAVERRNAALAKLTSATAIETRQKWARDTLWRLAGGTLERTPLNARVTGSFERDAYRVEKLIYESRPSLFVSANLYVPKRGSGPFPAVLFQSGHAWEAKAYPSYQRCCQGLVQLGFVVLAFDPMGQGERINYPDASGTQSKLSSCDEEHTVPGKQLLLFGDSATRFQLWDAIRSLDYLTSRPEVDQKRVASMGHSGGATLTMLLAAADDRLAAAAVCMGNTENVAAVPFLPPGATDDAEQDFVDSGPAGFDRWDLFYPFAPKPMLIWPSDRDFYATYSPEYVRNGWEEYQKLKRVYETLGRPEHLGWADTPLPHALAYDSRLLVYNWFTRWLKSDAGKVQEEPRVEPEPVQRLWATESGSVGRLLKSVTPFMLNKSRQVRRNPVALEPLLKTRRPAAGMAAKRIGQVQSRNVRVDVLEIPSAPEVLLPAYLLIPDKVPKSKPVLLVLDEAECDRLWFDPEVDRTLPEDSPIVCAADVRGIGALVPEFSPGAAGYAAWHEKEENYAWGSLILGRPLIGQRVTDILAVAASLRTYPETAGRPIHIAAFRKLTVPALFAAALDPEITSIYLAGGLVSFQNLIDTEMYSYPFANFIPGLLNHTDLPEIAATVAPRRITLAGCIDAKGFTVPGDAVRNTYRSANQKGNLFIREQAEWSVATLVSYANGIGT
jgi:pimeloyl-ACP methyl ester carboxylesterase